LLDSLLQEFEAFLKMPEAIVPTYTNIKSFKKDTMSNKWGYGGDNGPSYWHVVEGCAYSIAVEGTRQSPIDVKPSQVEVDEELGEMKYMYNANNCVSVENTGASWKVDVNSDGSHLSGGPLGKDEYKLIQFHAHWGGENGRGSEHTVDGKMFSAELHLVHYNTKYGTFGEAADKPDGLAVLGMLIKVGNEHQEFGNLCQLLKQIPNKGDKVEICNAMDPANFLPRNKSYWTYPGSLTTPPLFESVTWILFKQPIEVSQAQLRVLRELKFEDKNSECMKDNYRPTCPLKGRVVRTPKYL